MDKMSENGDLASSSMKFEGVATPPLGADGPQQDIRNEDPLTPTSPVTPRRTRTYNFTAKETLDLIEIWATPEIQWQAKYNFRHFRVWDAVSYAMSKLGHKRTATQCKNRIQNLVSIYNRIRKSEQDYRNFNFPYYTMVDEVMEGKKNGAVEKARPIEFSPELAQFATNYKRNRIVMNNSQNNLGSPTTAAKQSQNSIISSHSRENRASMPFERRNGCFGTSNARRKSLEVEHEDHVTITTRDRFLPPDHDELMADPEGSYNDADNESGVESPIGRNRGFGVGGMRGAKRSFSSRMNSCLKPEHTYVRTGMVNGNAAKRPRSSPKFDQIASHLAQLIDIQKQHLEIERVRVWNERAMLIGVKQILRRIVWPNHFQEEVDSFANGTADGEAAGEESEEFIETE